MPNDQDDPIVEHHCTKENPWNHVPPKLGKIIRHHDVEEVYPDCDSTIVTYRCLNCGHVFDVDHGD